MDEARLRFRDVYPLESVMLIFQKKSMSSITGSESSRLAKKYNWTFVAIHKMRTFLRTEIQATALLLDMMNAGRMVEPETSESWPDLVKAFAHKRAINGVVRDLKNSIELPTYNRAVEEAERIDGLYGYKLIDLPIMKFLTVNDVKEILEVSRETVYKYSDIRDLNAPLETVEYGGIHLWYPVDRESFLEAMAVG